MKISKLKKLRVCNDMSQGELAGLLEISQSYLSLLERDQRAISPKIMKRIDEVFGEHESLVDE